MRLAKGESDRVAAEAAAVELACQAHTKRQLEERAASIAPARAAEKPAPVDLAEAQASPACAHPSPAAQTLNDVQSAPCFSIFHCSVPASGQVTPLSLRLGQTAERLKFSITADFMGDLKFEAAGREWAAVLYQESDFDRICIAQAEHIRKVRAAHRIIEAA